MLQEKRGLIGVAFGPGIVLRCQSKYLSSIMMGNIQWALCDGKVKGAAESQSIKVNAGSSSLQTFPAANLNRSGLKHASLFFVYKHTWIQSLTRKQSSTICIFLCQGITDWILM